MKEIQISTSNSLVAAHELHAQAQRLAAEQTLMRAASGYTDERASINLPLDDELVARVKALAQPVDAIVVIGIGGSNLGTLAVHEAINGKFHNGIRSPTAFFADTVDADMMRDTLTFIKRYYDNKKSVQLILVSKSGGTTETIANFELLYAQLQQHTTQANKHVVAITDEGSALWHLSHKLGFATLAIPKQVGGRYSVFSAVGLYPLALLGVDIDELLAGARSMREKCLAPFEHNPAMRLAAIHYYHAQHKRNIADLFLFSNDLENTGKWYRQLVGESIGKEWNREHNKQVFAGITPTVSIGSTDLHSVGQLYLGGPQDKITTFVTVQNTTELTLPHMDDFNALVPYIQGRKLHELMQAIEQGVMKTFADNHRPFIHITLPEKNAYALGELLQLYMMTTMYLGALLSVNPFDQPNVESYKIETKRILSQ